MRTSVWTSLVLAFLSAGLPPARAEEKPTVQAYAVSVRKKLSKEDASIGFEERAGTRINVVLSNPGKTMIAVDEKASKLEAFKDDLGTDLTKAKDAFGFGGWVESFSFKASEKGDRALAVFNANGVPAAGAKTVTLKGTMSILCASGPKTLDHKDLALKIDPKNKIKVGDFTLTVEQSFTAGDLALKFESNSPNLKSVAFTTADGKAITTNKPLNSRFGINNKFTYYTTYNLRTKADTVNLTLTYYEKVEAVEFPVDLTVGLGL
jgi:hypothetical protein